MAKYLNYLSSFLLFFVLGIGAAFAQQFEGSTFNELQRQSFLNDAKSSLEASDNGYGGNNIGNVSIINDDRLSGLYGYVGTIKVIRPYDPNSSTISVLAGESKYHIFDGSIVGAREYFGDGRSQLYKTNQGSSKFLIKDEVVSLHPGQEVYTFDVPYANNYNITFSANYSYDVINQLYMDYTGEMPMSFYIDLTSGSSTIVQGGICQNLSSSPGQPQLDANICLSLNVVPACKFTQSVFSADFGTISAGEVAEGMATVSLICSTGQNYTLLPGVDEKPIAKQKETYKAGLYKDVGRSNRLQRGSNGVFATGNGQIQTIPLYLKVTGQGKDFGKGNVFIEAAQINETYPIELAY